MGFYREFPPAFWSSLLNVLFTTHPTWTFEVVSMRCQIAASPARTPSASHAPPGWVYGENERTSLCALRAEKTPACEGENVPQPVEKMNATVKEDMMVNVQYTRMYNIDV